VYVWYVQFGCAGGGVVPLTSALPCLPVLLLFLGISRFGCVRCQGNVFGCVRVAVWLSVRVCVYVWLSVRVCVYVWLSVRVCVYVCYVVFGGAALLHALAAAGVCV